jgi:hypothetical protein
MHAGISENTDAEQSSLIFSKASGTPLAAFLGSMGPGARDLAIDPHGQWEDETGRPVLSRLTWSRIAERSAHWESHRSRDGGKTWTKHWVIDFTRKSTS